MNLEINIFKVWLIVSTVILGDTVVTVSDPNWKLDQSKVSQNLVRFSLICLSWKTNFQQKQIFRWTINIQKSWIPWNTLVGYRSTSGKIVKNVCFDDVTNKQLIWHGFGPLIQNVAFSFLNVQKRFWSEAKSCSIHAIMLIWPHRLNIH